MMIVLDAGALCPGSPYNAGAGLNCVNLGLTLRDYVLILPRFHT